MAGKIPKDLLAIRAKAAAFAKKNQLAEAARSYRFYLSKAPDPIAYYDYAVILKKLNAHDDAIQNYHHAIALKPDYAPAHINLGGIHNERQEYETALKHYNNAIAHNPFLPEAFYNRGTILQELRRHDEALEDYDTALALNPNFYLAQLNKSVILYELKRKPEAARAYEHLLRRNPNNTDADWNLGILKLSEGDFAAGWPLCESRPKLDPAGSNPLQKPYWRGHEDLNNKTIFIRWEQGFGDTIQFSRYALLLKSRGAAVIFSVQNPLTSLLATLDPAITILAEHETPEHYDYFTYLMSLPGACNTTLGSIPYPTPYLTADPAPWRPRLAHLPGLKIGLVWSGGLRQNITFARRNDANRSLTLQHFSSILQTQNTNFISLQKGPPAAELATPPENTNILDFTDEITDFAATAALIANLDLVISVDTAVAHLAGALGKPTWILIPTTNCWRWLESRTDSPWYNSVTLYRQPTRTHWPPVLEALQTALNAVIANRAAGPPPVIASRA